MFDTFSVPCKYSFSIRSSVLSNVVKFRQKHRFFLKDILSINNFNFFTFSQSHSLSIEPDLTTGHKLPTKKGKKKETINPTLYNTDNLCPIKMIENSFVQKKKRHVLFYVQEWSINIWLAIGNNIIDVQPL